MSDVIILYALNNADSLSFAEYYANSHNLSYSSIVGVPCSNNEILPNYNTFVNQIEEPLLQNSIFFSEYSTDQVKFIIVGYGVPGGFYDSNNNIIATTSRLSRLNFPFTLKENNPSFFPANYSAFTTSDIHQTIVCSRIDAPTLSQAKSIVDNAIGCLKTGYANGTFYFDKINALYNSVDGLTPYTLDKLTNGDYANITDDVAIDPDRLKYYNILTNFENLLLPSLNMNIFTTYFWDNYTDEPLFVLNGDSIVWAWGADRVGYSYFQTSQYKRYFCYNADYDGGFTVRDINNTRWVMISLLSGYATASGAMSDPTPEGYLNPLAFFQSLSNGDTIGEAFIRSVPYLNWTVGLFGDPLVTVKFPLGIASANSNEAAIIEETSNNIANSMAYALSRSIFSNNLQNIFLNSDLQTKTILFPLISQINNNILSQVVSPYTSILSGLNTYINNSNGILQNYNIQLPAILGNTSVTSYPVGSWFLDSTITRDTGFHYYNFIADFSLNSDFSDIFLHVDSSVSSENWYYEESPSTFQAIPSGGVGCNYAGRRIRYIGQNMIDIGTIYYARIRQIDETNNLTDWVYYQKVGNN